MQKRNFRKILSMLLVSVMLATSVSWTEIGILEVQAADNAPKKEYSFEEISAMANIPVMNLTMADSSKYNTLKTDKNTKQDISKFELVNTNGKGSDITLETSVDAETGETIYPLTAKGRGNSSWTMPTGKKPYNIKFDKKQNILGMGKEKSWCLISNWVDTTYMRNYMAYELACMLGLGTPDCEMVALCIDGVFEGIYLITEKVGLNEYRTEIPDGENDGDKNGDGIVTEIIVEADIRADEYQEPGRFRSDYNVSYVPKDPDAEDLAASELQEIKKELNAMEAAVMTGTNYEEYIDVDSWVDTYIVNELAKNPDFGFGHQNCYASTYLYFREGGKVYAGPVWDFDIAYGRNDYSQMESEGYRDIAGTTGYLSKETKYYKELFENTDFEEKVIKRWKEIRETIIPAWMRDTFNVGYESVKMLNPIDIEIWGDHAGRVAGSYDMGRDPLPFEEEVAYVKNFITERVSWLDEQWNVDEITKKFSGSWTRWDTKESGDYSSYDELVSAAEAGNKKTNVADIWDGGYGGKEKSGTEIIELGSKQTTIPGVELETPFTITMERQRGQYDWSSDTTHAYDIWRDTEASQGFGGVKDSITVTKSGRYVGLTTAAYYVGDTTVEMGKDNVQVYMIDVGTDGAVTLYDGSVALSYEARIASVKDTNYGKIEAVDGGYKVSYDSSGSGNTGQTLSGNGNKQFQIYVPDEATNGLEVTTRPTESNYANQPLSQEATYIHAAGERPVAWSIEGDAITFDESTQKVTAMKAGTAVITATATGGLTSSVTIHVTEKATTEIEYEGDPTLGKYYGNGDTVILSASENEKGSWATMAPGYLTRFCFAFDMTKDDIENASGFSWQTKNGDQIIGGPADYYVFINGKPLFAATTGSLDYAIAGFDDANTIKIEDTELAEGLYAYMNGKAGSTVDKLEGMTGFVKEGTNVIDVFVDTEDGGATVLPYINATTKIADGESEPVKPDVPDEPDVPEIPAVEVIEIAEGNLTLEETAEKTLTINVFPVEAGQTAVTWRTSDETVVTVNETGKIVAKGVGTANITAVCKDNPAIKAEIKVTVIPVKVTVVIDSSNKVVLGEAIELDAKLDKEVSDTSVTWTIVAGEENAELEGNLLTAKAVGTVTIKATSNYNKACFATTEIQIVKLSVEEIIINEEDFTIEETKSTQLSVTILPDNVEDTQIGWSSSDTSVVTVDANGKITAVAEGTAVITAYDVANSKIKDQVTVTVTKMNYELGFSNAAGILKLEDFETYTLCATFEPETVPNKEVIFTSSNINIATVSENGLITAKEPGTVIITAISVYDRGKTVSIIVKVVPSIVTVTIDAKNSMTVGETQKLEASIDKTVSDTSVTWEIVDGEEYAELSGNALKAKAAGTVIVKATSTYNENCYTMTDIVIEEAKENPEAPMVPGTPLAAPIKISMELQQGQYEWSTDTTHAYDIWADGKAVHGFGKIQKELVITEAGRYVGITSASYYVGDCTVTMADGDVQVYVIDVANDGSVTVYDGKVKINYAQRATSVVDTTYANVERTNDGYFLSFKEDGTGNAGTKVLNK